MKSSIDQVRRTDAVIVGAGVAGLTAALGLARRGQVTVLTKSRLGGGCSSVWAQGGIAAAVGEDDSGDRHAADTIGAGAGICDGGAVRLLVEEGPRSIDDLIRLGTRFDSGPSGRPLLGREGAHSVPRILHTRDATGKEMLRTLILAAKRSPSVVVAEGAFALDLIADDGRVVGLVALEGGSRVLYLAPVTVLAAGGVGGLYRYTTNPLESIGDGLAMAARAGVRLADLEFVQFHPTALRSDLDPMPLITEALRGEGGVLLDSGGRRFMLGLHPLAELAPRDVVARAIFERLENGDAVFLDARAAVGKSFPDRFPTVFAHCRRAGIDPRCDPIPVAPAAHYHIGGIAVCANGRSSCPGLWACGEAAATGVHGANRLASNSLLEALVFGNRVAADAAPYLTKAACQPRALGIIRRLRRPKRTQPPEADEIAALRTLMWERVGLVRRQAGLAQALEILRKWSSQPMSLVSKNMVLAASLIAEAALARRESRGVHWRSDYPRPNPSWQRRRFVQRRNAAGAAGFPRAARGRVRTLR